MDLAGVVCWNCVTDSGPHGKNNEKKNTSHALRFIGRGTSALPQILRMGGSFIDRGAVSAHPWPAPAQPGVSASPEALAPDLSFPLIHLDKGTSGETEGAIWDMGESIPLAESISHITLRCI